MIVNAHVRWFSIKPTVHKRTGFPLVHSETYKKRVAASKEYFAIYNSEVFWKYHLRDRNFWSKGIKQVFILSIDNKTRLKLKHVTIYKTVKVWKCQIRHNSIWATKLETIRFVIIVFGLPTAPTILYMKFFRDALSKEFLWS